MKIPALKELPFRERETHHPDKSLLGPGSVHSASHSSAQLGPISLTGDRGTKPQVTCLVPQLMNNW